MFLNATWRIMSCAQTATIVLLGIKSSISIQSLGPDVSSLAACHSAAGRFIVCQESSELVTLPQAASLSRIKGIKKKRRQARERRRKHPERPAGRRGQRSRWAAAEATMVLISSGRASFVPARSPEV